jgi:hypothetical protein
MLLGNKSVVYSKSHRKQKKNCVGKMTNFLTLKEVENITITEL